MLIKTTSAFVRGMEALPITVELDVSNGLPSYQIVGHPDTSMKESKERIRLAILNAGFFYPKGRITVNMSPAEVSKRGSHFDLAIAMGMLAATGQLDGTEFCNMAFFGELSLDGSINAVQGILPMVQAMKKQGITQVFLPKENVKEALLVSGMTYYGIDSLKQLVEHLQRFHLLVPEAAGQPLALTRQKTGIDKDFADVRGQEHVKRAMMVAVAGGHGLLMVGSPSTGKTMLAERLPTIMPDMSYEEILETTTIYSVAGLLSESMPFVAKRPFRQPHHKLTMVGLLGGGGIPKPGEISLANKGVLFLDEAGEYDGRMLDALRLPLEKKEITLVRNQMQYTYPADFLLVAASNPCPCGYFGDPVHQCKCTAAEISRYKRRFSGPIMDRIDMHIFLMPISYDELTGEATMSSQEMREIIAGARKRQAHRYEQLGIELNHQLDERLIETYAPLKPKDRILLAEAYRQMRLNPRTMMKVRKLARTIADLEDSAEIQTHHLTEALQYRERHDER